MRIKTVTVGVVLAGTALGSAALSLGKARGAAWIGQPLELMVPLQLDPGQVEGTVCADADVFHGDSRQESSRVRVQVLPTDQSDSYTIKISSSALVDEPVVTVYLRAGCGQKLSKKFVLLAEFPNDAAAPLSRTPTPQAPVVPLVIPAESATNEPTPPSGDAARTAARTVKPVKPTTAPVKKPSTADAKAVRPKDESSIKVAAQAEPKAADAGKPRLRLDPLETLSERIKSLEANTTAAGVPAVPASEAQRMQQLQGDLRALLDQAVKNEASLLAMRQRLEKAESDRVPVALVYGLGALVVLCLGALAFLWNKRPRAVAWDGATPSTYEAHAAAPARPAEPESTAQEDDLDVNTVDMDNDSFDALMGKPAGAPSRPAPLTGVAAPSAVHVPHSNFNADDQVDLRQQADFLAKLGKVDEAIEALDAGIRVNPKESPLLFLDMLGICNQHSRKTDFRLFREEFMRIFNASIPEFALYRDEGRTLDAYPALLDHINKLWESPQVLDVIEACILRDPEAAESDPFDLAAFRELVNMHGVAMEQHLPAAARA